MVGTEHELDTVTFVGRTFNAKELELMRQITRDFAGLGVTEIARTVCELLDWKRASGGLKNHECRQLLEQLQDRGFLQLPPVRSNGVKGPRKIAFTDASLAKEERTGTAGQYEPLRLAVVESGTEDASLWREYVQRFHYMGYRQPFGAQLRYLVRTGEGPGEVLACMGWTSPAWKMADRDNWIGWSAQQREQNLQYIVNNSRFLILPWVKVKGLASKILSHCVRRLPDDWEALYAYRPLLLETLVETPRFTGVCYRASNWIRVGETAGRGRMDRYNEVLGTEKDIYVYPLCRKAPQRLCSAAAPARRREDELTGKFPDVDRREPVPPITVAKEPGPKAPVAGPLRPPLAQTKRDSVGS